MYIYCKLRCIEQLLSVIDMTHEHWTYNGCLKFSSCLLYDTVGSIARIAPSPRPGIGRVEVHHESQWGTVCDDSWDIKDADVICRMLNYSRALNALPRATTGEGNGPIWLTDVECAGNETSITDCENPGWKQWNFKTCFHDEDAGVVCQDGMPQPGKAFQTHLN